MNKWWRRGGALLMAGMIAAGSLFGCGKTSSSENGEDTSFQWWIVKTDGEGTYYEDYDENPAVQWLNNQYWDVENHTIGTSENGKQVSLTFQTPIAGSEQDNFNTMIGTGEYPEIINLQYSQSTAAVLAEDGVLMDLTEYVEKYMPNYVELLEQNPELKKLTTTTDEEGNTHYYSIFNIADTPAEPWQGYAYRRDWVVEYAEPTEYVWDWDNAYVKEHGHPAVTPLQKAQEEGNLEGWKKNDITEFTYSEGEDPDNDYTDNVIFPSGKEDPYTISDWEWMFEAFQKAIEAEGFSDNTDAYCVTVPAGGVGDFVTSFGGGAGTWSIGDDGECMFGGTGENFKTYLECMNDWAKKGWLDTKFETRTSDMFWKINLNGFSQGMVGAQALGIGMLGTTIRDTCSSDFGKSRAMVFGASIPINDTYGEDAQKFHDPDTFYQGSRLTGQIGLTNKCEGKDLATLFTMFNYMCSDEGMSVAGWGLSKEQIDSMEFNPDVYRENDVDCAYTVEKSDDGRDRIVLSVDQSDPLANALKAQRIGVGRGVGTSTDEYVVDNGRTAVAQRAVEQWLAYVATGYLLDYDQLLSEDESNEKARISTEVTDYMDQNVPDMIKNGIKDWDGFCDNLEKFDPESITEIYNQYTK